MGSVYLLALRELV